MEDHSNSTQTKTVAIQNKEFEQYVLKSAFSKLKETIRSKQGKRLFEMFDKKKRGYLTRQQFDILLIATGLKQFRFKQVRNTVTEQAFTYCLSWKLCKDNYVRLPNNGLQYIEAKSEKKNDGVDKQMVRVDEAVLKQKYPKAYKYCISKNVTQNELQYFHMLQNLLNKNTKFSDKNNPATHKGNYLSLSQIFNENSYELFEMDESVFHRQKSKKELIAKIQPKFIQQNQLKDGYLLEAISTVSSIHPGLIQKNFLFSVNAANFYVVKLFVDGEWEYIVTDDRFPCLNGEPVFAKPHGRQIWVMLLQKCWAKVFGSYQFIKYGSIKQGFNALTGAPLQFFYEVYSFRSKSFHLQKQQKLKQVEEKNYAACFNANIYLKDRQKQYQQNLGLFSGCDYCFQKIIQVNDEIIVKIRNLYTNKTFQRGQWFFQSSKWTKQLRDKQNYHKNPNDGSFYIEWTNLIKYFSQSTICRINPKHIHTNYKIQSKPHKSTYLKLKIKKDGIYIFSVYQMNERNFRKQQNYKYSQIRLILVKDKINSFQYINSIRLVYNNNFFANIQQNLTEGDYTIAIKVQWKFTQPKPIVFSSYGVQRIQIEETDNKIASLFKLQLIKSLSLKYKGVKQNNQNNNLHIEFYQLKTTGIAYRKIHNRSSQKIQIFLNQYQIHNFKIIKTNKSSYLSAIILQQNDQMLIGYHRIYY